MALKSYPTWQSPERDPSFAKWVLDLLQSNYGCPLEPYEIADQLTSATGYSEAELCEVFGYPADYFEHEDRYRGVEEGEGAGE